VTNNLLLRVLGSRETAQSRLICHRIFAFMNASSDPAQWPDGYTYHALVKGLVRSGQFRRAVQTMQEAVEKTEQRRRESGKQAEGPWRHTVEYLMGNLLGEGKMDLAERLREIMAKHGFVMGCPLPNIEDDD
jgi:pentatricopeptide repeat protein